LALKNHPNILGWFFFNYYYGGYELMDNNIYIIISKTPTRFGGVVRRFANQTYNHASIALDANLDHTYAFARKSHKAPLLGGLVRESLDRFTLRNNNPVPVVVFKIPVSMEQKLTITELINEMHNNRKYVYNLFSVLSYPITGGFCVKNAFSCIEFVSYILQYLGHINEKLPCKYKPDDLLVELKDYIWKSEDIRNCMIYNENADDYFAPFQIRIIPKSIAAVCRIIKHGFSLHPETSNMAMFHII
jgi:hypothetical protein